MNHILCIFNSYSVPLIHSFPYSLVIVIREFLRDTITAKPMELIIQVMTIMAIFHGKGEGKRILVAVVVVVVVVIVIEIVAAIAIPIPILITITITIIIKEIILSTQLPIIVSVIVILPAIVIVTIAI